MKIECITESVTKETTDEKHSSQNDLKRNDYLRKYASKTRQMPFIFDTSKEQYLDVTSMDDTADTEEYLGEFLKKVNEKAVLSEPHWIHDTAVDAASVTGKKYLTSCICSECGYHANLEKSICPQCRSKMK